MKSGPMGLFVFGLAVITSALLLTSIWVRETLPWARAEGARHAAGQSTGPVPRYPQNISATPSTWEVFALISGLDVAERAGVGLGSLRRGFGIYRFWRDTGYGIGALLLGWVAHASGALNAGFWFVAIAMFASGLWVLLRC